MNIKLLRPLASIDVETTGDDPEIDYIIQIGIVKVNTDGQRKEWETFVKPPIPIPSKITEITSIKDEHVANAKTFKELAPILYKGLSDCDICAYQAKFDVNFLKKEFKRAGYNWKHGKLVDPYRIFNRKQPRSLSSAVEFYLGREHKGAHTALADATAALDVFEAQLEKHLEIPRSVDKIHYELFEKPAPGYYDAEKKIRDRNGILSFTFGKFKNTPLSNVSTDYFQWVVSSDSDFSDRVKEVCKLELEKRKPIS